MIFCINLCKFSDVFSPQDWMDFASWILSGCSGAADTNAVLTTCSKWSDTEIPLKSLGTRRVVNLLNTCA